jgi:hypothetical protein
MKIKTTLVAGSATLLAAVWLAAGQLAGPAKGIETTTGAPAGKSHGALRDKARSPGSAAESQNSPRKSRPDLAADLARWDARLRDLQTDGNSREQALHLLLDELAKSFEMQVMEEVLRLENVPPLLRHGRLVDLQSKVGGETAAVINHLGLNGDEHMAVAATAMQPVWAEMIYAGAASDPASRLSMLMLEKERLARLKSAMTIQEYDARQQAVADLSSWHQAELEAVLGTPAVP